MLNSGEQEISTALKTKMLKNKDFLAFKPLDVVLIMIKNVKIAMVFIMLIKVKMPTIVGILTFMSAIILMLT